MYYKAFPKHEYIVSNMPTTGRSERFLGLLSVSCHSPLSSTAAENIYGSNVVTLTPQYSIAFAHYCSLPA